MTQNEVQRKKLAESEALNKVFRGQITKHLLGIDTPKRRESREDVGAGQDGSRGLPFLVPATEEKPQSVQGPQGGTINLLSKEPSPTPTTR